MNIYSLCKAHLQVEHGHTSKGGEGGEARIDAGKAGTVVQGQVTERLQRGQPLQGAPLQTAAPSQVQVGQGCQRRQCLWQAQAMIR